MLPESRIYTCVDFPRKHALHLLEAQKLIYDMAFTHSLRGTAFAFFRNVCLSIQPILCLLKRGEHFGFYIDSEKPYFRLKIELMAQGSTRALLYPENFLDYPETVSGTVRLNKFSLEMTVPYQSVIEVNNIHLEDLTNKILQVSYQISGNVCVSEQSDQSLLLLRLPNKRNSEACSDETNSLLLSQKRHAKLKTMLSKGESDPEKLKHLLEENSFEYLAGRTVVYKCNCSREGIIQNLHLFQQRASEPLFETNQSSLKITCEYCKNEYMILREDLNKNPSFLN